MRWATDRGISACDAPFYGVCPDDPDVTAPEHLRFDACVSVDARFMPDASVGIAEIAGGAYAVGVHVGPFARLAETYLDVIGRWFPKSGYELAPDPVTEHYLDDPAIVRPEDLRTEVCVKIAE
jgi:AraC family transcriptional regulator